MRNRILDGLQESFVEFRVSTQSFQFDLLSKIFGDVAHHSRKFFIQSADRLHAGFHHILAKFGSDQVEAMNGGFQFVVLGFGGFLKQAIAQQNEFTDQVHLVLENVDVDSDRSLEFGRARFSGESFVYVTYF